MVGEKDRSSSLVTTQWSMMLTSIKKKKTKLTETGDIQKAAKITFQKVKIIYIRLKEFRVLATVFLYQIITYWPDHATTLRSEKVKCASTSEELI